VRVSAEFFNGAGARDLRPFPNEGRIPTLMLMARYRIDGEDASVSIEVTDVAGQEQELLEAFGECQAGQCSCPPASIRSSPRWTCSAPLL
jgi:hypothetical protein